MHKTQNEEEFEAPYYIMCNEGPVMCHTVLPKNMLAIAFHQK